MFFIEKKSSFPSSAHAPQDGAKALRSSGAAPGRERKKAMRMKYAIGKNGAIAELKSCPHCQSTGGYFRKMRMSGETEYHYNYDGTDAINDHIHDGLDYVEQKTLFCIDCKQPIGTAN